MEDARKYKTTRCVVSGVAFVLNAVLLIYLLTSQSTFRIRAFAQNLTPHGWPLLTVLIYFVVVGTIFTVIQLPLDFFSGPEHRFGLSRQSCRAGFTTRSKAAVGAGIGLIGVEIVYLMRYRPMLVDLRFHHFCRAFRSSRKSWPGITSSVVLQIYARGKRGVAPAFRPAGSASAYANSRVV